MSTLGADNSVFSIEQHQALQYNEGSGAFLQDTGSFYEAGGAVGGTLVSSNRKYGKRSERGLIRVIPDSVGTLNYKSRTVKEMLEASELN